jgi:hypothetical protein
MDMDSSANASDTDYALFTDSRPSTASSSSSGSYASARSTIETDDDHDNSSFQLIGPRSNHPPSFPLGPRGTSSARTPNATRIGTSHSLPNLESQVQPQSSLHRYPLLPSTSWRQGNTQDQPEALAAYHRRGPLCSAESTSPRGQNARRDEAQLHTLGSEQSLEPPPTQPRTSAAFHARIGPQTLHRRLRSSSPARRGDENDPEEEDIGDGVPMDDIRPSSPPALDISDDHQTSSQQTESTQWSQVTDFLTGVLDVIPSDNPSPSLPAPTGSQLPGHSGHGSGDMHQPEASQWSQSSSQDPSQWESTGVTLYDVPTASQDERNNMYFSSNAPQPDGRSSPADDDARGSECGRGGDGEMYGSGKDLNLAWREGKGPVPNVPEFLDDAVCPTMFTFPRPLPPPLAPSSRPGHPFYPDPTVRVQPRPSHYGPPTYGPEDTDHEDSSQPLSQSTESSQGFSSSSQCTDSGTVLAPGDEAHDED